MVILPQILSHRISGLPRYQVTNLSDLENWEFEEKHFKVDLNGRYIFNPNGVILERILRIEPYTNNIIVEENEIINQFGFLSCVNFSIGLPIMLDFSFYGRILNYLEKKEKVVLENPELEFDKEIEELKLISANVYKDSNDEGGTPFRCLEIFLGIHCYKGV